MYGFKVFGHQALSVICKNWSYLCLYEKLQIGCETEPVL